MENIDDTFQSLAPLSDLVLIASDGSGFRVHKVFLARSSFFFRDMFLNAEGSSSFSSTSRLNLDELQGSDLKDLLNCIYWPVGSPSSPFSLGNVKMLTEAARKYEMPMLLAGSDEFCCKTIEVKSGSVVEWLGFAHEYGLEKFSKKCEHAVKTFSLEQMIGHLTPEQLEALPRKVAAKMLARGSRAEGNWRIEGGGLHVTIPFCTTCLLLFIFKQITEPCNVGCSGS